MHADPRSTHGQLRAALDAGAVGTWRWDVATGVTTWDARMERLFGFDPGSFDGSYEAWVACLHPDDRQDTIATLDAAVASASPYVVEHRINWPDGSVRWIQGRGATTCDADGVVTGTVGCAWDVTDRALIAIERETALARLAVATERERAEHERLEFLARVTEALAGADRREDIMRGAAFAAVPRLGDWCVVSVLSGDDDPQPLIEVAHADPAMVKFAQELTERFPYDPDATSGAAQVIRTGETEFLPHIDEEVLAAVDTTDAARDVVRQLELKSSMTVPLISHGRTLGALQFVNTTARRRYTADDVTLAEAAAGRIASALENRRLLEELRQDEFRGALDAMLDDVAIACAVRDRDGRIVDFVIDFINAGSCDGAGRSSADLQGASVLDAYPGVKESGLFDRYVHVVEEREPLVIDRMPYQDVLADGRTIDGWWSLQVVPFGDGYLASSRDETEQVLAEETLAKVREAEAGALIAVDVLQSAALPQHLPRIDGVDVGVRYQPAAPAMPIGGDWYDLFPVPGSDGAVGVVVADVAGHGPASAALMVQVRNMLRVYAMEGYGPEEVLRRSNEMLRMSGARNPFVTCCYLLLEPGRTQWACAGHFPPLHRSDDGVRHLSSPIGPPLGVVGAATYRSAAVDLAPGDALVLFTDGLFERPGESIDVGLRRLRDLAATAHDTDAQAMVDRLVDGLATDQRRDDVAVVGILIGP